MLFVFYLFIYFLIFPMQVLHEIEEKAELILEERGDLTCFSFLSLAPTH